MLMQPGVWRYRANKLSSPNGHFYSTNEHDHFLLRAWYTAAGSNKR